MRENIGRIILMGLIIVTVTTLTARAVTGSEQVKKLSAKQYKELEQTSVSEVKKILEESCLYDSGVMLTKESGDCEACIYQVQIHHKGLESLDDKQKKQITEKIVKSMYSLWGSESLTVTMVHEEDIVSKICDKQMTIFHFGVMMSCK